jgi:hypothetical protein
MQHTYRPTPEGSAAIDEAIRSFEAGKGIPAGELALLADSRSNFGINPW